VQTWTPFQKVEDAGFSVAKLWLIGDLKSISVADESHVQRVTGSICISWV
jgi:hypothetical protein